MKRSALFVGVNRYDDPGINPLKYAENDAIELHGFFRYSAGYDDVRRLSNPDSQVVLDTVGEMLSGLGKGDLFLFFFAGHGVEHEKRHLLLCPRVKYGRLRYFQETVPVDLLEDETRKPGLSRLFILDACRTDLLAGGRSVSGEGLQGTAGLRDIVAAREPEVDTGGFALLCSCGEGQQARELPTLCHGIFAEAFLYTCGEGLRQGRGLAVSDDLIVSLQTRIDETGGRAGAAQRPWIKKCGVLPPLIDHVHSVQDPPPLPSFHPEEEEPADVEEDYEVDCPHCGETQIVNEGTGTYECTECGGDIEISLACPKCKKELEVEEWNENEACPYSDCKAVFDSWEEAEIEDREVDCPHCGETQIVNEGTGIYECTECGGDIEISLACPKCKRGIELEEWNKNEACPYSDCEAVFDSWVEAEVAPVD